MIRIHSSHSKMMITKNILYRKLLGIRLRNYIIITNNRVVKIYHFRNFWSKIQRENIWISGTNTQGYSGDNIGLIERQASSQEIHLKTMVLTHSSEDGKISRRRKKAKKIKNTRRKSVSGQVRVIPMKMARMLLLISMVKRDLKSFGKPSFIMTWTQLILSVTKQ